MINLFCAGVSAGCALMFFIDNHQCAAVANLLACLLNLFIWYVGVKTR